MATATEMAREHFETLKTRQAAHAAEEATLIEQVRAAKKELARARVYGEDALVAELEVEIAEKQNRLEFRRETERETTDTFARELRQAEYNLLQAELEEFFAELPAAHAEVAQEAAALRTKIETLAPEVAALNAAEQRLRTLAFQIRERVSHQSHRLRMPEGMPDNLLQLQNSPAVQFGFGGIPEGSPYDRDNELWYRGSAETHVRHGLSVILKRLQS